MQRNATLNRSAFAVGHPISRVAPFDSCVEQQVAPHCVLEREHYSVRVAGSHAKRDQAAMLVKRLYASRGYCTAGIDALLNKSHQITLVAFSASHVLGTLTVRFDSAERLLADALYEREIDQFRARGRKVAELCAFAVDPQYSSKELLASLFQAAYICGRATRRVADAFIEVNPHHAPFYKRMLDFHEIGPMRTCLRVNAPAVLLHLDLDYMDRQIQRHSGSLTSRQRCLYPYFVVNCKPDCLVHRIAEMAESRE